MTARTLDDDHFLLLDGWQHRRQPGHWQGWLAERLVERGASVDYLTLPDPEHPRYDDWSSAVRRALSGHDRVTVVAHGLSVLLWLRMCGDAARADAVPLARRAALIAPPAPGLHGGDVSAELPGTVTAAAVAAATVLPAILISSIGDPYLPEGADARYGVPLGLAMVDVPGGAHLNQAAGFGPWPEMLTWCETGQWPEPVDVAFATELAMRYTPAGHRLGIVMAGSIAATEEAAVKTALLDHGHEPERRLARLQARAGEESFRAEDVAVFGELYGHEYSVAILQATLFPESGARERIEAAYRETGCAVIWRDC